MADELKAPTSMTDSGLLREWQTIEVDAGENPRGEALIAEIKRRNLDF